MPKVTEEHKKKRRREILDVAKKVFIKQGFQATTMSDIVSASNMSRGGVYSYFSTTDEMYKAIIAENDQSFEAYFQNLMQMKSYWNALLIYLDDLERSAYDDVREGFGIVAYEYLVMTWREKERIQFFKDRVDQYIKLFAGLIESGVKREEFHPVQSSEAIALMIINTNDAVYLLSMTVGADKARVKDQVKSLKIYLRYVLQVKHIE
ncbi:TetR family transcriptional regulator [Aquibacillus rhizosphaerae]|uniref:TetR family transcriptional regulator n=1 Tax=Aquibacillus rhizosphaerae TaxID=3051431 RepID=A0ABT7L7I4_9BACI|nr:TetR family transcriptional regulator [Aquibacillus sp. LR5S19]MDL4841814.1 TetR family transcriptional regulator [Aquibacillus sp. LR5S19]